MTQIERFWAKVRRRRGCWEWRASKTKFGYGKMMWRGRLEGAHRISWELFNGPPPAGMWVLHKCDTPSCTRPDHLFLGSPALNSNDMIFKRRAKFGGTGPTLTPKDVTEIRRWFAEGLSSTILAKSYGVDFTTIRNAITRRTWRFVNG
jgi:hypothetical protein